MRLASLTIAALSIIATGAVAQEPASDSAPIPLHDSPAADSSAREVYDSASVDVPAIIIKAGKNAYPDELAKQGVSGVVRIGLIVDTEGYPDPASLKVLSASDPRFEKAALKMVLTSRFRPALLGGKPVAMRMTQKVQFRDH